jgi:pectinesterase
MKVLRKVLLLVLGGLAAATVVPPLSAAEAPAHLVQEVRDAQEKFPPSPDLRITRNIEYARYGEGPGLQLDLYLPPRPEQRRRPLIVVIRGGGWHQTDKEGFGFIAAYLAKAGFAAVSIEYRPAAKALFPAALQDAKAAVRWARANADRYGFDPDRIGAMGGSAGGHLAALLATTAGDPRFEGPGGNAGEPSRVAAVVAMSADTDFRGEWSDPEVMALLGPGLHEGDERLGLASPVTHVTAQAAPLLLIHSRTDDNVPFEQSLKFKARYEAAGVPIELITLEDAPHAFFLDARWFPGAMDQAIDFFRRTFAATR